MTREIAYRALASWLRLAIREGEYDDGRPLPTEKELADLHGVSRQTVRRAMQDLVAEGSVYRVPGRGTYVLSDRDPYVYQVGAVQDLITMFDDTECELITPLHEQDDPESARRLRLEGAAVMALSLRRWQGDAPFCYARIAMPPAVGELLRDVPELTTPGRRSAGTVVSMIDSRLQQPITSVEQTVSAMSASAEVRRNLELRAGTPILRVDRRYFDSAGKAIELVTTYFDSKRYSFNVNARRRSS